ncbi:FAD-dependent monooxygenase [Salinarimonas soli]|uniref:FAD-binding monooxygenase n=1 Tax=Salinarimonas soli TaxID=1638099 RepID=A0A5B2VCS3_9HYPH|nr:FAD-dependent monooxygenase [Salinarimonas soli]KAA2237283.1 FAD-binding monooxygenase [Salinarimonas soli]
MTDAVVVGAGIAGLVTALCLSRIGIPTTLVERRTGFTEVGAGLQLSPNASRILIDLGLGAPLRRVGFEPERVVVRRAGSGREIGGVALGPFMRERFGAPYLVVQRIDLQTLLLDAVRAQPNIRLLVGRAVEGVTAEPKPTARLRTAAGALEEIDADLIVGADGVRSRLRAALGDDREPAFKGYVAWRATIPREAAPRELAGNETGLWLGPGGHVVHYPIAGGRLLNIVAVERRREPVEGWSAPGDPAVIQALHARSAEPLRRLLAQAPDWLLWSLLDLPAKAMSRGALALVGDAAHPVLPFLAQGAALAIEDAAALAGFLRAGETVEGALKAYAAARLPRARRVQGAARRNGGIYHARAPVAFARDLVMGRRSPEAMTEAYAWLYGWGPAA